MRKLKVAFFTAHPDDFEVMMAGTALKYQAQGHEVYLVIATDGRRGRGDLDDSVSWQEIVNFRIKEAHDAVATMNIKPIMLGIEDHRLVNDRECYEKVITAMESINPDVIFTCPPNDYHNDHRCISTLVLNSAWAPVFYADPGYDFIPDFYVDITDYFDKKIEMLKVHKSQMGDHDPREWLEVTAKFRALQCAKPEIKYAEAYKVHKRFDWVKAYELLPVDNYSIKEKIVPTTERN